MEKNFAFLDEVLPGIRWDVKCATRDNFTGEPVDGHMVDRIVGAKELGAALRRTQKAAEKLGYDLLLQGDYRLQCAVDCPLNWASLPKNNLIKERYYPNIEQKGMVVKGYVTSQSSHSRGSMIDLTIFRLDVGMLVPMDGDPNFMDIRSHYTASGLSEEETNNRESLRAITERSGSETYRYGWWHHALVDEPYSDIYSDFCIA